MLIWQTLIEKYTLVDKPGSVIECKDTTSVKVLLSDTQYHFLIKHSPCYYSLMRSIMIQNATRNTCKPFPVSWLSTLSNDTSFIWDSVMFFFQIYYNWSRPRRAHTRLKVFVGLWVITVLKKCSYIFTSGSIRDVVCV